MTDEIILNELRQFLVHHNDETVSDKQFLNWKIAKNEKNLYLITQGNRYRIKIKHNLIFILVNNWYCTNYNTQAIMIEGEPYVLI